MLMLAISAAALILGPYLTASKLNAARQVPRTIENTRLSDETTVQPDDTEVFGDEKDDEFAPYYSNEKVCSMTLLTALMPNARAPSMTAETQDHDYHAAQVLQEAVRLHCRSDADDPECFLLPQR